MSTFRGVRERMRRGDKVIGVFNEGGAETPSALFKWSDHAGKYFLIRFAQKCGKMAPESLTSRNE